MSTKYKQLNRSRDERMVAGICGGLGEYFDIDPTVIRLIFVFGTILTGSALFWAYLVMMFVVPEEPLASEEIIETQVEDVPSEESE